MVEIPEQNDRKEPKSEPYVYLSDHMSKWWMEPELLFVVAIIVVAIFVSQYL